MMDVRCKNLFILVSTCLVLSACKEPELEMSSLGKKLPAPALKGTNPFDQEVDTQGYVRIQGSCDTRVGTILVSFDKSVWHQPPASPNLTGTSLSVGLSNDSDCADAGFDIYITKTDLLNIWGIDDSTNVDYIYLKGSSLIGDTETLTLVDSSPGSGPSGGAVTVALEKSWPRGFAGSDQCSSFYAFMTNSSGYRATHTVAVSFNINKKVAGTSYPRLMAYKNWNDCNNDTNITDTFTIKAGDDSTEIVYRFPAAPIDGILDFTIANPTALTASASPASVTLRSSDPASTKRWLSMEDHYHQIYKNTCYQVRLRSNTYTNSPAYDQFGGTLNFAATDARVKFYTTATCTAETTNYTFASYDPLITSYIKFTPGASDTDTWANFQMNITGNGGNSYSYDVLPFDFRVDLSSQSIATKLDFWGPRDIVNGHCNRFNIVSMNSNGTQLPVNGTLSVNLATQESNVGAFYSDETCYSPITSTTLSSGSNSKTVYFKPTASTTGTYHFNVTASGMSNTNPLFNVASIATQFKIAPFDLTAGICKAISVGVADYAGTFMPIDVDMTTTWSVNLSPTPGSNVVFTDPSCSTPYPGSTISFGAGSSSTVFYIQTSGLSGYSLNINVDGVAGLSSAFFSGTLQ